MKRKNAKQVVSVALSAAMVLSTGSMSVMAKSNPQTTTEVTQSEIDHAQTSMNIAKEGVVLLENNNNALPIASEGNVARFTQRFGRFVSTKKGA